MKNAMNFRPVGLMLLFLSLIHISHNKTYYMVTTNVGAGNFFVKTQDPFGEWSDPIMLPEVTGICLLYTSVDAIRKTNFRVAIDCVNSGGGSILPELLERLGVKHVEKLYCEATGDFQHTPEPLEKNLRCV